MGLFTDLKVYNKWRSLGKEMLHKIIEEIPREVLFEAARDLRMLNKEQVLVFDSEDETAYLMDRMIYDIEWQGKRNIEIYCDKHTESFSEDEWKFLEAMKKAYYSLFTIEGIRVKEGLHLADVFSQVKAFLTDVNLSKTVEIGHLLSLRVISIDNINFTSGCFCVFENKHLKQLKDNFLNLFESKRHTMTWEEMMRKYNPYFFRMMKQIRGVDIVFVDPE